MNVKPLSQWPIRGRLLLISALPVGAIVVVFITYFVNYNIDRIRSELVISGNRIANYASLVSEFAFYAGDRDSLQDLAKNIVEEPGVVAVQFRDLENNPVAAAHKVDMKADVEPALMGNAGLIDGDSWYFSSPILLRELNLYDHGEQIPPTDTADPPEKKIGWVVVVLDRKTVVSELRQVTRNAILLGIFALLASITLSMRLGRSISRPVIQMTRFVKTFHQQREHVSRGVRQIEGNELAELQDGINRLADDVVLSEQALQRDIESATLQLQKTLAQLESQNTELHEAKEHAEQAVEEKDQFMARMSHELRTPLTSIIGFLNLLRETPTNKEQREYLQIIRHSSNILLSTINDILEIAKLEATDIDLELQSFRLESALDEMIALHSFAAFKKGLEIVVLVGHDVPDQVVGDKSRLMQALNNLVANAVKFTESGQVILSVSVNDVRGDQTELRFVVSDSGIGIDQGQLSSLFQPYSQANYGIGRRFGGTGLGLFIVKRVVESMGGLVSIKSNLGEGTTVSFSLWLDRVQSELSPLSIKRQKGVVLCYDSNAWARRSLRNRLLHYYESVFAVSNFDDLFPVIKDNGGQLDFVMLGLSPQELNYGEVEGMLELLRRTYAGNVVLLAGAAHPEDVVHESDLKKYLPITYIRKPIRNERIVELILDSDNEESSEYAADPMQSGASECSLVLARLNILLAEDNEFNRKLIEQILVNHGARVTAVENGIEALDAFAGDLFDVIILDIHMPRLDGIQTTEKIRSLGEPGSAIPIIALTANVIENELDAMKAAGIDATLYKPIDENELISKLCGLESYDQDPSFQSMYTVDPLDAYQAVSEQVEHLGRELSGGEYAQIRETSHQLRGVAGMSGFHNVSNLAASLDDAVLAEDLEKATDLLRLLELALVETNLDSEG